MSGGWPKAIAQHDSLAGRLTDGGPVYFETCLDCPIVEPYSAASAVLFVAVAVFWAWRVRGQFRRHAFISACLPIIALGGLGSLLYHGTRAHRVFFLIDVFTLVILCLAASLFMWAKAVGRRWWIIGVALPGALLVQRQFFVLLPTHVAINVSYAFLATLILLPTLIVLGRTQWRGVGWVIGAVGAVAVAIAFRALDTMSPPVLPMGTHWLTHVFGAVAAHALIAFVYRLGFAVPTPPPHQTPPTAEIGAASL